MKVVHKIAEISVILITLVVLLAPLTSFAEDSGTGVTATGQVPQVPQVPVDPEAVIEKAFAEANPGEEIGKAIGDAMGSIDNGPAMAALLIPIMGIFGALIAPMLLIGIIVWLGIRYREHKEQRNHETIRLMIEKGVPIPPDLSFGESTQEKGSPLNRGLKLMGIGAGLIVFFLVMGMGGLSGIGAIPLFIGLAYLLISRLEKNKPETGNAG